MWEVEVRVGMSSTTESQAEGTERTYLQQSTAMTTKLHRLVYRLDLQQIQCAIRNTSNRT
jgi:hypothetical protein